VNITFKDHYVLIVKYITVY